LKEIEKEIKTYSLSDLLKNDWKETRELYEEIKEKIISLDSNIEEKFNKYYIAYQIGKSNVVSLHVYKSKVVVHLPKIQLNDINDYKKLAHNVPEER
jgi:predicted transport protein